MTDRLDQWTTRRDFIRRSAAGGAAFSATVLAGLPHNAIADERRKPRVAAIFTVFRHRSHAHVLLENFLEPYLFSGRVVHPGVEVVSFYADQLTEGDMAKDVARTYNIPLYDSIEARSRSKRSTMKTGQPKCWLIW